MVAGSAIFTALAFAISFLEIVVFPSSAVSFLKLDFSNVFIMLAGFMYGPLSALFVGIIKEVLCILSTPSPTFGVGQLANMAIILIYVLPPSIVYLYKKGIWSVIISLSCACILQVIGALIVNRFITFPLYGKLADFDGVAAFNASFWLLVLFNVIKSVSVSFLTIILYKRIGYIFDKINIK